MLVRCDVDLVFLCDFAVNACENALEDKHSAEIAEARPCRI